MQSVGGAWKCSVCGTSLSRKQRLKSHWETLHQDQSLPDFLAYEKKKYKRYAEDPSVPVPKRTRIRHGQTHELEEEALAAFPVDQENDIVATTETLAHAQTEDQVDYSECETLAAAKPVTGDPVDQSDTHDELTSEPVDFNTTDEKRLAILSFISRNKLTSTAAESFLRLLHVLECPGLSSVSLSDVRTICNNINPTYHDYCSKCKALYPEDETVVTCDTNGCNELRFKGSRNQQTRKRRKSYFTSLSLASQLKDILERPGMRINETKITLTLNTDGVPLYNSSAVSIWPVFLVINELPPATRFLKQNTLIWGLWQGQGKPVFQTFLRPFVDEMNVLQEGLSINVDGQHHTVKVQLTVCTLDLQAKAYLMEMTQHNGHSGCITCEEPGETVAQGKGYTRAYPSRNQPPRPRTADSVLTNAEESLESTSKKPVMGIRGVSALYGIDDFDPVVHMVPDYMHGVLLGTTKKLLSLWFAPQNSKQPYYLGNKVHEIDQRLLAMQPTDKITRLPRSIQGNLQHWKASEFQNWLLYYGVPCLIGIIPTPYFDNFTNLVEGIYILLGDSPTDAELNRARTMLTEFYITFEELYGKNNCGLNIHNIGSHLVDFVQQHGPLWAWSCFPFEDLNGLLLKSCHGTGDVSRQLLAFFNAEKQLISETEKMTDISLKDFAKDMLTLNKSKNFLETGNCKVAGKIKPVENLSQQTVADIAYYSNQTTPSLGEILRIQVNGETVCSTGYSRMEKRVCYAVLFNDTDRELGLVQHFFHEAASDMCFAEVVILRNLGLVVDNVQHIIKVERSNLTKVIPVSAIVEKLLYLQGNIDNVCVCRMPNLYGQCG